VCPKLAAGSHITLSVLCFPFQREEKRQAMQAKKEAAAKAAAEVRIFTC